MLAPRSLPQTFDWSTFSNPFKTSSTRVSICSLGSPAAAENAARCRRVSLVEGSAATAIRGRAILRTARRIKDILGRRYECRTAEAVSPDACDKRRQGACVQLPTRTWPDPQFPRHIHAISTTRISRTDYCKLRFVQVCRPHLFDMSHKTYS